LAQAEGAYQEPFERAEGVERRATTIQAAVAVAASFAVAGAGLLLDRGALGQSSWRYPVALAYLVVMVSLVAAALRALRASTRVHYWTFPNRAELLEPGEEDAEISRVARAAGLLYCAVRNEPIARYKVAQMRAAGFWFAWALIGLALTAVLIAGYLAFGDSAVGAEAEKRRPLVHELGPSPEAKVLAAFAGPIRFHSDVPEPGGPLCLVRYTASRDAKTLGRWWTSCQEARGLETVARVRERLALPARFGAKRDVKIEAEVPPASNLAYLTGRVAPQCELARDRPPCQSRTYPGGAEQFYILRPAILNGLRLRRECSQVPENEPSNWGRCRH
jgi:hypothetical protein